MTDPTDGVPSPQPPQPAAPPPAVPAPPPVGGSWSAPPPAGASAGGFNPNFQQAAVEAGPAPGVAYSDLVTRIIAMVIDGIILAIPWFVLATIAASMFLLSGMYEIVVLVLGVAWAALSAGYFVWTWTTQRATYGQKFLKLETVNAADGATLTRDQAIKRWAFLFGPNAVAIVLSNLLGMLGSLVSLLVLGYAIFLLYTASQSSKRQGFHDVQAGTVVIKKG